MSEIFGFTQSQSSELLRMLQAYKSGQWSGANLVSSRGQLRPDIIPFKFVDSGQTLVPYGIAEIYGVVTAGEPRLHVRRPTGDDAAWYIINTNASISHNANGWGTLATCAPALALYDDADTPAFGKEWGPQPTSYELKRGRTGFICQGTGTGGSTDRVSVIQQGKQGIYFGTNSVSAAAKGANATVTMKDASGTTFGFDRTVKCRLAGLEASYDCHISMIDGVWELVGKECEV